MFWKPAVFSFESYGLKTSTLGDDLTETNACELGSEKN